MAYGKYARKIASRKPRRYRPKKRLVKRAVRAVSTRLFNQKVKKVLFRNSETKVVNGGREGFDLFNVKSLSWNTSVINLLPAATGSTGALYTIGQGELQGNRIGNKISTVSCVLKGCVRVHTDYNETVNYNPAPLYVQLWIVKIKPHLNDDIGALQTIVSNTFFQNGSVSIPMSGKLLDNLNMVNTSQITVLKRRVFKIGYSEVASSFGTNLPNNGNQRYMNNDFSQSRMFKIDLTKIVPKTLTFNDGTDTPSNTRKIWMFCNCLRADNQLPVTGGADPSTTGPIPAELEFSVDYNFKDM